MPECDGPTATVEIRRLLGGDHTAPNHNHPVYTVPHPAQPHPELKPARLTVLPSHPVLQAYSAGVVAALLMVVVQPASLSCYVLEGLFRSDWH